MNIQRTALLLAVDGAPVGCPAEWTEQDYALQVQLDGKTVLALRLDGHVEAGSDTDLRTVAQHLITMFVSPSVT